MQKQKIKKLRADEIITKQGLVPSRSQAKALIMAGKIRAGDVVINKAGEMWPENIIFEIVGEKRFVSRGGYKLLGALEELNINVKNFKAIDIGASTGGFTDCLLQSGALSVAALDVGKNLLDWSLITNPQVTVYNGINARYLEAETYGVDYDIAVIDVSFISLKLILPTVANLIKNSGQILAMVKPQFEVGKENVGKQGVVKDVKLIKGAVDGIANFALTLTKPLYEIGRSYSKVLGPKGNQEVFLQLSFNKN